MSALLAINPIKKESASGLSELADSFDRHVQLLNKLETVEEHWNSFLVERLSSCLDHGSLREWETHLDDGQRPTYKQLVDFIHKRSRIITTLMLSHTTSTQSESKPSKPRLTAHVASENVKKCPHCKQAHLLFQCSGFQSLVPQQRFEFVKKHGLCINCLKGAHLAKDCSSGSCKQCSKKHHSLLHLPPISSASAPGAPAVVPNQSVPVAIGQSAEAIGSRSYQVPPRDANAAVRPPSAISGASPLANSSFRTFPQSYSINSPVSGIGQSTVNVHFGVTLSLASRFGDHRFTLDCLVLPKLTVSLPSHHINVSRWQIPRNLPMADPQFNISQKIDIIIGAELFFSLLEHQQISLAAGCPLLQKTVLGYIVCGKISDPALDPPAVQTSHICTDDLLDKQLERFWEIDNFDVGRSYTPDEQRCEDHFQQTVGRDTDGRYIVRLPLREDMLPMLGDSYQLAFRRLQSMEKKFAVDEGLRIAYYEFLEEYESLGHMEEWRHVPSEMNPADRISRGLMASQISKDDLWWHGPSFLKDPVDSWPECVVSMPDLPDLQQEACPVIALHSATVDQTLCERFTDLSKLIRVVARCYRFFNNSRLPRSDRTIGSLTPEEGEHALKILVRQVQLASFPAEVHHYRSAQSVPSASATSKSPLKDLKLFMDQFDLGVGCLEVAYQKIGRAGHSNPVLACHVVAGRVHRTLRALGCGRGTWWGL
nr:uncharacterized protein LOC115260876 [Aedes albopictus]